MTNQNCEIRIQHTRYVQVLLELFTFLINTTIIKSSFNNKDLLIYAYVYQLLDQE